MPMLPPDAEPLSVEGFFATVSDYTIYGFRFEVMHADKNGRVTGTHPVCELRPPGRLNLPGYQLEADSLRWAIRPLNASHGNWSAHQTIAHAECLGLAANLAVVMDATPDVQERIKRHEAALAEAEQRRARRREELERQREEHRAAQAVAHAAMVARVKELHETLRWYLDGQFRLKRDGKRSTVFGTIRRFSHDELPEDMTPRQYAQVYMETISEKNKLMRIFLKDINWFEIKEDRHARRFTNLYDANKKEEVST